MINFIESHLDLVLLLSVGVIELVFVVISFFRKKRLNNEDFVTSRIDSILPGYINLAEASDCDGSTKLSFVVDCVLKNIKRFISKKDEKHFISLIIEKTEAILSTPQKKGQI